MQIVFLEIDTDAEWAVCSLGPAFLAAVARQAGHQARMLRIPESEPIDEAVARVRAAGPDLIGISMTTRQWLRGRALANALREVADIPLLAGGLHATFSPDQVLGEPGFDAVCLGEGEAPFAALLRHLERGGTLATARMQNIWIKGQPHPGLAPPVAEIDDIPFMARDMLDERYGVRHMTTQRGCPFPCTYCAARMYDQLYDGIGTYGRRRTLDSVMAELKDIRANGELNYVIFLDDTFTINHPWVFEFCKRMPEEIGVGFSIHARAETLNPKLIAALAAGGCKHVVFGVESGSERLRREVMKRPVTNARMIEIFQRTRDAGMIATANYMMGVPGETREDLQATLDLHRELKPTDFGYFVFYPFPGTQLFEHCRQHGYLPENWQSLPARHDASILNLPDLTPGDIAENYAKWTQVREEDTARRSVPAAAPVSASAC
ncbi:B12-binding domain-containing radical SAM protein [Frigidibacter sp. ROC022]|uniref:B12-binding domain-containing radical SAM protein n=1 Tax=Frigidibacter sp. ROC022 TaxID=2971796 RepID=UPI00215A0F9D|nr:radical SAM protein [Frigidibacter sp. ROC022]MCR8725210.1 B12-binding domain-containing radical SAM protein [Frigidibacter sp. ROC022]